MVKWANIKKVCIVGASGKLGRYMVQHALDRGYEVVGVCRQQSIGKLDPFKGRITVVPGDTNDPEVIKRAVEGCDGVLTVLVPWGVQQYSTGTAQAVLDHSLPGARLIFSCGWHITRDGQDVYCGLSGDLSQYLVDRGVKMVGVDRATVDCGSMTTRPAHVVLLQNDVLIIEGLRNLDEVANRRIMFFGLPLKIRGGTGSPIRAVGVLDWE